MSDRTITDEGVTGLSIQEGRAELLEEIMAIPTEDQHRIRATDGLAVRRRTRWLPVVGAAAAVAAIAAVVAVPPLLGDEEKAVREAPIGAAPGSGEVAVLELDGWALEYASVNKYGGELSYEAEDSSLDTSPNNDWGVTLDIHWRLAEDYDAYVKDRQDIGKAEDVEVLGEHAFLWSYSDDDHTAIRDVVGDFTLEVRGSGMTKPDYLTLLGELEAIAPADLDAHLPEDFVTDAERADVVADMLADIPVPDGFDTDIKSDEVSRYQLGADVTGTVTCAWISRFEAAQKAGDEAAMQEVVDAMGTSRDWAILQELAPQGGWSQVIWDYARQLENRKVPEGYGGGIGCEQD